jgi:hypothetical protein
MSWIGRVLAVAACASAGVVLGEIGARRLIRARGFYSRYRPHLRYRIEIDRAALPNLEGIVRSEINSDGERGDPPSKPGERVFRALVIGGSAAECFLLDQKSTWAAVAQGILNQPDSLPKLGVQRAHVGIAARAILPCAQINLLLKRVLPRYGRLDAVLIMVGASDVVSWMEQGMPQTLTEERLSVDKVFETHPEGPWGVRPKETAIYSLLSDLNRQIRKPVLDLKNAGGWLHRVRKMRAKAKVVLDETADPAPMLAFFDKHLRATIETAKQASSRVIVIRQPWFDKDPTPEELAMFWNFGLGRPYKEQVDTYCSPRLMSHLMSLIDARTARAAEELGVEQVDARPSLPASQRVYYDELHLTNEGARELGRAVAEAILQKADA